MFPSLLQLYLIIRLQQASGVMVTYRGRTLLTVIPLVFEGPATGLLPLR